MTEKTPAPFSDAASLRQANKEHLARSGNTRVISPLADQPRKGRDGRMRWVRARQTSYVNGVMLEPGQTTTWPKGVKILDANLEECDSSGRTVETPDEELSIHHPHHSSKREKAQDDPYADLHPDDAAILREIDDPDDTQEVQPRPAVPGADRGLRRVERDGRLVPQTEHEARVEAARNRGARPVPKEEVVNEETGEVEAGEDKVFVQSGNDPRPQDKSLEDLVNEGEDDATRTATTKDVKAAEDRRQRNRTNR